MFLSFPSHHGAEQTQRLKFADFGVRGRAPKDLKRKWFSLCSCSSNGQNQFQTGTVQE